MRVLFTTTAGSGHFHPLVPIARASVKAGHHVAVACPASFRPTVEALGFPTCAAGRDGMSDPEAAELYARVLALPLDDPASIDAGNRLVMRIFSGPNVRIILPQLRAAVDKFQPDLVVSEEGEFGGPVVAELLGLPYATVGIGLQQLAGRWADSVSEALDPIRVANGLPSDPDLAIHHRHLQLTYSPATLEDPGIVRLPTTHVIRPELFDDHADPPPAWLADLPDRPTVYATLGTEMSKLPGVYPDLFRAILDALAGEPVNLIVTVGRDLDPAGLEPVPGNAQVERYVPQSRLLPHCAAMVCHGGSNTVLGAVAAGLPLVLTPIAADGPLNAERCAQVGLGVVLQPNERTPEQIRAAVRAVLDEPGYRDAAKQVAAEIESAPRMEHAVTLLEGLVGVEDASLA
ncbi:glycosyltransferase [Flindersiella endophytica]